MTHASVAGSAREVPARPHPPVGGIETGADLVADLEQAFAGPARMTDGDCVDFGSTFTKALLSTSTHAEVVATANSPTTIATDVMDGWNTCRAAGGAAAPAAVDAEVLACSSAGGDCALAVVGNEELVTAEAGDGWRCPVEAPWCTWAPAGWRDRSSRRAAGGAT
jgi:hypothetical protein